MHLTYLVVTAFAALMNAYAAALNFARAESVQAVANRLGIAHRWMLPFGVLLAAGAVGLLVGTAAREIGMAAAIGLIMYFMCAVTAHMRAHDTQVGGALFFLLVAIAALVTNVADRRPW
ncbi:hypothetical protein BA895_22360 [Humibacillus sp. DSM 29435]|uniref:DoxX family protein n=1 Tax=Humibacillus sp. DSM 29435 TaxID=1869167 RepID=UPI000872298F|nr:DoxX family protein [Humibacillus sp. DSM 29435]OFE15599.1 hypothetical protein BA895_22360 [Humibacillus sp. DSM 29435]